MVLHCCCSTCWYVKALQSPVLLGLPIVKTNSALSQKKRDKKRHGCCCQQGSSTVKTELLMKLHNNADCNKLCTLHFTVTGITGSPSSTYTLDKKKPWESHILFFLLSFIKCSVLQGYLKQNNLTNAHS